MAVSSVVSLVDITEENYQAVCRLQVTKEQEDYVASPVKILARAYAKRSRNARGMAITADETIVGVIMYMDVPEPPACYTIEQFLIDHNYQNRGIGRRALQLAIDILAEERKFDAIEICVKMKAAPAIKLYTNAGFIDTGYIDPSEPDSYCLRYCFGG